MSSRIRTIQMIICIFAWASNTWAGDFHAALEHQLKSLVEEQGRSGAFTETQCADKRMSRHCDSENSIFMTGLIVDALSPLRFRAEVAESVRAALGYLSLRQAEYEGLIKYFPRSSPKRLLIKKDTDVNSIILGLLLRNGTGLDPALFEELTQDTMFPRKVSRSDHEDFFEGRIFATWLEPSKPLFDDVDVVVNTNALWLFGILNQSGIPVPGAGIDDVCRYVNRITEWSSVPGGWQEYYEYNQREWFEVEKARVHSYSAWYPSPYALAYSIARSAVDGEQACLSPALARIQELLLASVSYGEGERWSHYDLAVGAAALARITQYRERQGEDVTPLLAHLESVLGRLTDPENEETLANGFLYYGYNGYIGSRALFHAYSAEALSRYLSIVERIRRPRS